MEKQLSLNIEGQTIKPPKGIPKQLQGGNLKSSGIVQSGYSLLFTAAIILAVIFMLYAGITFITSKGDPTKLAESRKRLKYAILGLVVVILAFAIVSFVLTILGGNNKIFLLK